MSDSVKHPSIIFIDQMAGPLFRDLAEDISADNEDVVREMHNLLVSHLKEHNAPDDALKCWGRNPRLNADGSWAIDYE